MKDFLREFVSLINPPERLQNVKAAVLGGKNNISHNYVSESISLDSKWIDEIEAGIFHIEKIVKEPKTFIKDEEYIIDVERAKKTSSRTIRHLASHTRNIANVENDEVKPKRVLTIENEEDLGIYENRFIAALIERLQIFVEKRYKDINDKMTRHEVTSLTMDSEFAYGKTDIKYNLSLVMKQPPIETDEQRTNLENIDRIDNLRKRLRIMTNTEFYKMLSRLKPVRPPIAKTNILKMNVDYNSAYKLWLYISSYTLLGYSVETKDKSLPVDSDYYDDIIMISSLSIKNLLDNDKKRQDIYENIIPSKPKKKKFKLLKKVDLKPNFKKDDSKLDDDAVNEYYYNQIKEALKQALEIPDDYDLVEKKELDLGFAKFVRTLGQINFEMYEEIINKQSYALTKKEGDSPKSKAFAIRQQEKIYKRYLMLSNLKSDELETALRAESREYLKLEKMKAEEGVDFTDEIVETEPDVEEQPQKPTEKIQILKERAARTEKVKEDKINAAKKKSEAILQKKITASHKKTRDFKAELYLKDQQRLIDISEDNKLRKIELQKRRSLKN